ncbi:MAG: glycosyltransferase [Gammaproteobacteria bacterium]
MDKAVVVQQFANPSTDYFVLPHLRPAQSLLCVDHSQLLSADELDGYYVVFVRYVPNAWKALITRHRQRLAGVAYFMDDDLLDWSTFNGLPLHYRLKLLKLAALQRGWLRKIGAELWVSTDFLAAKYADWNPKVIAPRPEAQSLDITAKVTIFYHGSASHRAEIEWLLPIMREVLSKTPATKFEIIGNAATNRLYRQLPRVTVVHPMPWRNYREFCRNGERQIGLAPLLPSAFNAGRSHTKFFDILTCGAAGVFSRVAPFADFVCDGVDGLLLDNDPQAWVETLIRLTEQPAERNRLIAGARRKAAALARNDADAC